MNRSLILLLALSGCSPPKDPPIIAADDSQAVFDTVDGAPSSARLFTFINNGEQSTERLVVQLTGDVHAFHITVDTCSGAVLQPKLRCNIRVELASDDAGSFDGELHVSSDLIETAVLLSGRVTPAELAIATAGLDDAQVEQGGKAMLAFTVTNLGGATTGRLRVTGIALPYDIGGDCEGNVLVGGDHCTVQLSKQVAHDAVLGTSSGTLEVVAVPGGNAATTAKLSVTPGITLTATDVDWGSIPSLAFTPRTVTFRNNTTTTTAPLSVVLVSKDYTFSVKTDTCTNLALAPGQSCTVDVNANSALVGKAMAGALEAHAANFKTASAKLTATVVRAHWTLLVAINGKGQVFNGSTPVHDMEMYLIPNGSAFPQTLTATPNAGASFSGWSGVCSGMGTCGAIFGADNSDLSVTATFSN